MDITKYYPHTTATKLGYLVEECGEVMAAVGKTQRWGLASRNPTLPPGSEMNGDWILRELKDLEQAIRIARSAIEAEMEAIDGEDRSKA